MLSFNFETSVADVDGTVESDPFHPTLVMLLELGDDFIRVIVPDEVLLGRREMVLPGQTVLLSRAVNGLRCNSRR